MLLANVAWTLALNGHRVLVVDWDLEAPGIHRYFHPFLADKELKSTPGLLDMVEDLAVHAAASASPLPEQKVDIIQYVEPLEWPRSSKLSWKLFGTRAGIDLMPAGRQGPAYARTLAAFQWIDFYERLNGRHLLAAAREQMRLIYDYVLIDSRTGVSDTSGICTVEMPDTLVVCFALNNQNILGSAAVAASVREQRSAAIRSGGVGEGQDSPAFRILPVPTRVEITSERDKREAALDLARETFAPFLEDMSGDEQSKYWGGVQMAYFPFYAFEEIPAVFGDKPDDVLSLTTAIKRITRAITDPPVDRLPPLAETMTASEDLRREILGWYLRPLRHPVADTVRVAREIYAGSDSDGRAEMLRILLRLVDVGTYAGATLSTRTASADELEFRPQGVAQLLLDRQLISMTATRDGRLFTLADAALLQEWDTLREEIALNSAFLAQRSSIAASAISWQRRGGDDGALLRGTALDEAVALIKEREHDFSKGERGFVQASLAANERYIGEQERERLRVRALERLVEKEDSLWSRPRLFGLSLRDILLAYLLVAIGITGAWFVYSRNYDQRRVADELAAQVEALRASNQALEQQLKSAKGPRN